MSAVKKQEPKRQRPESSRAGGLTRVELELPDGRYLLSYARTKATRDA